MSQSLPISAMWRRCPSRSLLPLLDRERDLLRDELKLLDLLLLVLIERLWLFDFPELAMFKS